VFFVLSFFQRLLSPFNLLVSPIFLTRLGTQDAGNHEEVEGELTQRYHEENQSQTKVETSRLEKGGE
jgi:hypothetical protein